MTNNKKTKIELYVIDKIKSIRIDKGFTQEDIAEILDTTRGFIGQMESHKYPTKYNLNHLNTLAIEFGISIREFFPEKPIKENLKRKKQK